MNDFEVSGPRPNSYDATDPEVLARQEALIAKILSAPDVQIVPGGWEDEEIREQEGFELNPEWKEVPNPWQEGEIIKAAPVIAEDEDGIRHFAVIGEGNRGSVQYYGWLYRLNSDRILMRTPNPDDQFGALPIPWNSLDAKAFLTLAESLLADS